MKSLQIYLVEDDPLIAETIKTLLEEEGYIICGENDNAKAAIFDIEQLKPDLIIADIMLDGDLDGVDMMHHINKRFDIPFIYLTSLSDQMTLKRVTQTHPSGFIVKPFNENTLVANIELAYQKYKASVSSVTANAHVDSIFIKTKGELVKVAVDEILYLEAYDNYCKLYTSKKKLLISHTMKYVSEKLPQQPFLKVHRSYIVNYTKIDSLQEGYVFISGYKVPVSRTYKDNLMQHLNLL